MSVSALNYESNLQGDNYQVLQALAGQSVNEWLDDNALREKLYQQPTVVELNGAQLCEREYDYVLRDGDHVALVALSQGPLAAIPLMVWVAVAAVTITALVLPGMMEPDLPTTADQKEGSPLYSTSVKGNRYRPGSKGAILYGTTRVVPDFSQQPFSEFDAEDQQHYFMRFRITQGIASVDLNTAKFEDTPLSNFTDVEIEHILPGQKSTLVPKQVIKSNAVTDIELNDDATSSYVVCGVGEKVNRIGFDLSAQALYSQDREKGNLRWYTVKVDVQAQAIDDNGDPTGAWQTLGQAVLSNGDADPLRRSFTYAVPEGRYQVRLDRVTPKNDSTYVQDTVRWVGLKGYEQDDVTSDCTEVALVMRSSNQVGNRALTNFSVVASRHLPVWSDVNGWSVPQQTNHFAWALADLCRNDYAGRRSDAHYKLEKLAAFAARPDLAGAEFNAYYDTEGVSVWDALEHAGMPGRVKTIDYAGQYWFVRDEAQASSVQKFTMRNIVRGSYGKKSPNFVTESADSVIVKFRDKTADYEWYNDGDGLLCKVPESPGLNPREVTLFGVDNPTEAKKIGMWLAAQSAYRRQLPQWQTGQEGRIPFYGRQVTVSHFVLGLEGRTQISGDVMAIDSGAAEVDISEPVPVGLTEPRIVFRYNKGEPSEAFEVTVLNAERDRVRVLPIPDGGSGIMPDWSQIRVGAGGEEDTHFALGEGVEFMDKVKVTNVRRSGDKVALQGYVDDPRVYLLSDDVTPPPAYNPPGKESLVPLVRNLRADLVGTAADPVIVLDWDGANCDYYEVQISDDGINFVPYGSKTISNRLKIAVEPGHYHFRVYGFNLYRGAPAVVDVQTSTVTTAAPPAPENLALREAFTGPALKVQWDGVTVRHRIAIMVGAVEKYAVVLESGQEWDFHGDLARENDIGRGFTVRLWSVGENSLLSDTYIELAVYNDPPPALNNLLVDSAASTAIVAFDWPTGLNDLAGISVWAAGTTGFTPGAGNLVVDRSKNPVVDVPIPDGTLYLVVAAVDVWGDSSLNFSGEYSVSAAGMVLGPDSVGEENLKANSVTAAKMLVLSLSSIVANLGTVTAGLFKTVAGIGKRLEIEGGSSLPFWIGVGDKTEANGEVYYNQIDERFVVRDPASGFGLTVDPGDSTYPFRAVSADGSKGMKWNKVTETLELNNISATGAIEASSLKAGVAMVQNSNLGNAAVNTLKLAGQSVVIVQVAQSTSGVVTNSSTWQDALARSITIDSAVSGSGVIIDINDIATANISSGGSDGTPSWGIRLRRGGSTLKTWIFKADWGDGDHDASRSVSWFDQPGAGSFTYYVDFAAYDNGDFDLDLTHSFRKIQLTGAKR